MSEELSSLQRFFKSSGLLLAAIFVIAVAYFFVQSSGYDFYGVTLIFIVIIVIAIWLGRMLFAKYLYDMIKSSSKGYKKDQIFAVKIAPYSLLVTGILFIVLDGSLIFGIFLAIAGVYAFFVRNKRISEVKNKNISEKLLRHNKIFGLLFIGALLVSSFIYRFFDLSFNQGLIWGVGLVVIVFIYHFLFRPR